MQAERNKRVLDPLPDLQRTLKNQADTAMAVRAVDPARLVSEWGSFANAEYEEARQRGDTQGMSCWSAEGACRAAGHGVMGGLLGGSGAAIGAGLSSLAGPSLAQAGAQAGLDPEVVAQLGATGLGALLGGGAGAVAANNEIRNNYLGLIRLIQLGGEAVARGGAAAGAALSAEVQAAMFMCARSSWCASLPLAAGAIAWVNSQNSVSLPESPGVSQIPGYTRPLPPDQGEGRTVTPADRVKEPTSTSTPGDGLTGPTDTGGKQIAQPKPGDGVIISPIPGSLGSGVMISENSNRAHQFEQGLVNLPPGERVAEVKGTLGAIAKENGWVKDTRDSLHESHCDVIEQA